MAASTALMTLLITGISLAGCKGGQAGGSSAEPAKDNFKGDPTKMTPEQRKQMEAAMSGGKPPANAPVPK